MMTTDNNPVEEIQRKASRRRLYYCIGSMLLLIAIGVAVAVSASSFSSNASVSKNQSNETKGINTTATTSAPSTMAPTASGQTIAPMVAVTDLPTTRLTLAPTMTSTRPPITTPEFTTVFPVTITNSPTTSAPIAATNAPVVLLTPTAVPNTPTVSPSTQPLSPATTAPTITTLPLSPPPTTVTTAPSSLSTTEETLCNGHSHLCDKRLDEILFATVHNAHNAVANGITFFANHQQSLEDALEAGYRGINIDIGLCDGQLQLVHGFCSLGFRAPMPALSNILSFARMHPHDVILMPTQINEDTGGEVTLAMLEELFDSVPGWNDRLYTHQPGQPWPTLREMSAANTTIVFFYYNNGEPCRGRGNDNCPLGFNEWFYYATESEYSFPALTDLDDPTYACQQTRGLNGQQDFYGVNVFTQLPSPTNCQVLNTKEFLTNHMEACMAQEQRRINLLLIDCWDVGDALEVVRDYNLNLPE